MKISNLNEFYNYIKTKESLNSNGYLMSLCACVDQFKNICSCKAKEKGQKLFDCNNQYVNTIKNLDQNLQRLIFIFRVMSSQFFSYKIRFYSA